MRDNSIRRRPPASITILAVLHLVGGGLGLLLSLCGWAMLLAGGGITGSPFGATSGKQGPEVAITKAMENVPGYRIATVSQAVMDLTLDAMLIAAGIGLLRLRRWARSLSLVYAVLSILGHILLLIWTLEFLLPPMREAVAAEIARMGPQAAAAAPLMGTFLTISSVAGHILIVYPLIVLFILLSPSIAAEFRGESAGPSGEEYDDEGWRPMRPPGSREEFTDRPAGSSPRTLEPPAE